MFMKRRVVFRIGVGTFWVQRRCWARGLVYEEGDFVWSPRILQRQLLWRRCRGLASLQT